MGYRPNFAHAVMCERSWVVVSAGGCNEELGELFGWCHPAEGLSRASVEAVGGGGEVGFGVLGEVGAFREVLTGEAVGVLVAAAHPRAVRITEIDLDPGVDREPDVFGHFAALVPGDAAPQRGRQGEDFGGHRVTHDVGGVASAGQV